MVIRLNEVVRGQIEGGRLLVGIIIMHFEVTESQFHDFLKRQQSLGTPKIQFPSCSKNEHSRGSP